jgi:hypothetical protein
MSPFMIVYIALLWRYITTSGYETEKRSAKCGCYYMRVLTEGAGKTKRDEKTIDIHNVERSSYLRAGKESVLTTSRRYAHSFERLREGIMIIFVA